MIRLPAFGVDAVPLARAAQLLTRYGPVALRRTCTEAEAAWVGDSAERLAVCLALKEAGIKTAGGRPRGFTWQDVHRLPEGPPRGEPVEVKDVLAGFERDLGLVPLHGTEIGFGGTTGATIRREAGVQNDQGLRATARHGVREATVFAVVVAWREFSAEEEGSHG